MSILSRKSSFPPQASRRLNGPGPSPPLGGKAKLALARLLLEEAERRGMDAAGAGAGETGVSMRPGQSRPTSLWTPFNPWLKRVTPDWEWDWPHLVLMQETLGRILSGELRKVMFFIPPRHGKPVYNGSMILLNTGERKPISEIRVGDRVITHLGRSREVLEIFEQGALPTLRITTDSGRSTIAALSHPFLTTEGWKRADELVPGMCLANVLKPECPGSENRPLEEFRLAGYFVGDGHTGFTNHGIGLAANITCLDPIEGEDLFACGERLGFGVTKNPKYAGRYDFKDGVRPWLRECGLAGKTSHHKRVPDWVFRGSPEQIGHFVGAYFSCDGSINLRGKARLDACVEFYSVNRPLLADVQHLLLRLGVQSRLKPKKTKYHGNYVDSWRLSVTSQDAVARFAKAVPLVSIKSKRLKEWGVIRDRFDEPLLADKIVSVEPAGDLPCRCLTVEEDHTFTSDDFVVHNTEQNTVRFASYVLEHDPAFRFIVWAYNQTLVEKFSRKIRRISSERMELSHERKAAQEWETLAGGGVRAAGVGVGITGMGANGVIIDDPVKSREEAESEAYRERVWDSYRDDLFTRLEPGGFVVLTMTRWHEDDLAGRILNSEDGPNWHVVCCPAIAESQADRDEWARKHFQPGGGADPLGRQEGEALCPDRYNIKDLLDIKRVLGSYGFTALYQQRPAPPGGMMFKREWFRVLPVRPAVVESRVRAWDLAATEDGDYTAGALLAKLPDGSFCIEDMVRGRWTPGERDNVIIQTAHSDGPDVHIHMEQEPGSSGKSVAEYLIRKLAGYRVHAERSTGEKTTRAQPFAAQCEAHNVSIVGGTWNAAYFDELMAFPNGRNDDQVDASSSAFNRLALVPRPHAVVVSGARPSLQERPSVAPQRPGPGIPGALRR